MLGRLLTEAEDWWMLTEMSTTLKTMTDAFHFPSPSLDLGLRNVPEFSTVSARAQNDDAHGFDTDALRRMPLLLLRAD